MATTGFSQRVYGVDARRLHRSGDAFAALQRGRQWVDEDKRQRQASCFQTLAFAVGRGDRIRTCDHLVPNQERYRTALHPAGQFAAVGHAVMGPPANCRCKGITFPRHHQTFPAFLETVRILAAPAAEVFGGGGESFGGRRPEGRRISAALLAGTKLKP